MRILVATDLSDDGEVAIDAARVLRARHGGSIAIAHVIPPTTHPEMLLPGQLKHEALEGVALSQRVIQHLRTSLSEDLSDAELLIEEGNPAERLLELAKSHKSDLVVLGGREPSGKRVFGSVAEAVLTNTRIPVLIARQHPETGEMIAATDLADDPLAAVTRAVEAALPTHARITVVHVLPKGKTKPDADDARVFKRIRKELPPTGKVAIEQGEPAATIVAVAERHNAELIVVASRGRKGLARFIIGSVASAVVRKASCSVLVVPLAK